MKSIDQTWLIASGSANAIGFFLFNRFFGLIRRQQFPATPETQ
jgi:hypothetical protein